MKLVEHTDADGNIYVLIPQPHSKKGDPTCVGCAVRAASMIPGGSFCRQFEFKCNIPFNKHVWYQVYWGAYPKQPRLPAPTLGDSWYQSFYE